MGVGVVGYLKRSVPVYSGRARWAGWVRGWRWRWVLGVVLLVVAALVWGLWPSASQRYVPDARSRQFSLFTVCVLTGSGGIGDARAVPVWAGVVDASKATGAQGSYLSVPAPESESSAVAYVNTLAMRHCSLVVAVGDSEVAAVAARADAFAAQRFVVVGSAAAEANVAVVRKGTADAVRSAVAGVVEQAAVGRFTGRVVL